MALASMLERALGGALPVRVTVYDGSAAGPTDAAATVVIHEPDAFARVLSRPGELGFARAYVSGDLDIEGDLYALLSAVDADLSLRPDPVAALQLVRALGPQLLLHPPPPPPEEARMHGGIHSRGRDREAISYHYDVSNEFYEMVLGPSMTYSCAVFERPETDLTDAQTAKYDLICRKLALAPGMRLLDVGCGWGGMLLHAAGEYGVKGVGVTLSVEQEELARKRVAQAGLEDQIEIRLQDYRDITDGPFDAISSIGMFEHVGRAKMGEYARCLYELLRPKGRLMNHAISRPGYPQADSLLGRTVSLGRRMLTAAGSRVTSRIDSPFMERYVFPDGELLEVGVVVSLLQEIGFEVRHVEGLRDHYALTLRNWVANLEANWAEAVAEAGEGRARVWRLYMAASAVGFERGNVGIHQVLGVRSESGRSGFPLRPAY